MKTSHRFPYADNTEICALYVPIEGPVELARGKISSKNISIEFVAETQMSKILHVERASRGKRSSQAA